MGLFNSVKGQLRQRSEIQDPQIVPVAVTEAKIRQERMNGRKQGLFAEEAKKYFLSIGKEWPSIIFHEDTGTIEVPSTSMGLMALMVQWDSMLSDEEFLHFRSTANLMIPMGLVAQHRVQHIEAEEMLKEEEIIQE